MRPVTTVAAATCRACGDTIFSRAGHDMRPCSCDSIAIDGGAQYTKLSGDNYQLSVIMVPYSKAEIRNDWNRSIDKIGKVNGEAKRMTRKKRKQLRPVSEALLKMEPLLFELVDDHGLQLGELLGLVKTWAEIHFPNCIEKYTEDGSRPEYYYGPPRK